MRRGRIVVEADQCDVLRHVQAALFGCAHHAIGHLIGGGEDRGRALRRGQIEELPRAEVAGLRQEIALKDQVVVRRDAGLRQRAQIAVVAIVRDR